MLSTPAAEGQSAATGASTQTTGPVPGAQTPAPQPANKVWTNDDLSSLQGDSAIPAGGNPKHKPAAKLTQTPAKKKSANPYQGEIAKLQAQLPAINDQIAELQAVLSGNTVNTPRKYVGVKPDSWQIELDQLQTKRADIQSQIDALEDQARHSGVPANTLP